MNEMDMQSMAWFATIAAFVAGIWIGVSIEAKRWRANADAIQRLESKGRLYKVERL